MAGAQLVGTVDIDENGIEGIEYLHNSILCGPGFAKYMINPFGEIVETIERQDPVSGQDVQLTIDKSIQYHAYEARSPSEAYASKKRTRRSCRYKTAIF